jgi:hypothetical protein
MNAGLVDVFGIAVAAIALASAVLLMMVHKELGPFTGLSAGGKWMLMGAFGMGVVAFGFKMAVAAVMSGMPERAVAPLIAAYGGPTVAHDADANAFDDRPAAARYVWQPLPLAPAPPDNPTTPEKVAPVAACSRQAPVGRRYPVLRFLPRSPRPCRRRRPPHGDRHRRPAGRAQCADGVERRLPVGAVLGRPGGVAGGAGQGADAQSRRDGHALGGRGGAARGGRRRLSRRVCARVREPPADHHRPRRQGHRRLRAHPRHARRALRPLLAATPGP